MSGPMWFAIITCLSLSLCVVSIVVGMRIERALSANVEDESKRPVELPNPLERGNVHHLPFRLTLYNQNSKEIRCPPVWLTVDKGYFRDDRDWILAAEKSAKELMFNDAECNVDWEEYKANWRNKGKP